MTTVLRTFCTGEHYYGQSLRLASFKGWHGLFGHLNVVTPDNLSHVTGRGKHDRVVAFVPDFCEQVNAVAVYCRVDHVWGLGMPTEAQIRAVIRQEGIRGKWRVAKITPWPARNATEVRLVAAAKSPAPSRK